MKNLKIPSRAPRPVALGIAALLFSIISIIVSGCSSEEAGIAAIGTATAGLAGIWICFIVIVWLASIFFFVVWIIMLVDCAKRDNKDFPNANENSKLMWILIIVLAGSIGAIIYYFLVMRQMPKNAIEKKE